MRTQTLNLLARELVVGNSKPVEKGIYILWNMINSFYMDDDTE